MDAGPTTQTPFSLPPEPPMAGHQQTHHPCILHLDVLELILQEHRNDHSTLASTALASQPLLQIARKFLYRSVSLDYCENPYGYEQQRNLRLSLAQNPHLCGYVRSLRVSLPASSNSDVGKGKLKGDGSDDEALVLDVILRALVRLESLHVIGNGIGTPNLDALLEGLGGVAGSRSRGVGDLAGALKKVFGLPSLRKVTLENIYPLEEVFVSCFTELKHLELVSVGPGLDVEGLSNSGSSVSLSPPSSESSSISASTSTSTLPPASDYDSTTTTVQAELASSMSSAASSLVSELLSPPLALPSSSSSAAPTLLTPATLSPNPVPSPSEPPSTSQASSISAWCLDPSNSNRTATSPEVPFSNDPAVGEASSPPSNSTSTNGVPPPGFSDSRSAGGICAGDWNERDVTGRRTRRTDTRTTRRKGRRRSGSSWQHRVYLEYLVVNLEHLRPVLDLVSRARSKGIQGSSGSEEEEEEECDHLDPADDEEYTSEADGEDFMEPESRTSTLDFSKLKQIHVYVWDPNDADGIWSILHSARKSLERITLRYFQYTDDHLSLHSGFENLQSLVLGTDTVSIKEDPFRPLIQFFNDPAKFPSLRRLKISFDLWGCESSGATWKEVAGYRGWKELDGVLGALDVHNAHGAAGGESSSNPGQLSNIIFEIWCSSGYKGTAYNGRGLLVLIKDELSYLRRNQKFMLV